MKKLESNIANEKIRTSWFESSSSAPKPSVSKTNTFMGSPSGVVPSIGLPQIHTPYMKKSVKLFLLLVKQMIWNFEVSMICLIMVKFRNANLPLYMHWSLDLHQIL